MRLLDRYLLRELVIPLGYCLSGFLVFWIASELFANLHSLQDKHLDARDIAEYYLFRIPDFLPVALPVALLLALLYALTNHARHNEITAIRAAGVSLWRLCVPYLAVGFAGSVVLFALNEYCAPKTSEIALEILNRHALRHLSAEERQQVKGLAFQNSRENRKWYIGSYNRVTGEMIQPLVKWDLPDGSWRQLLADRAIRTNGVWTFYHVTGIQQSAGTNFLPVRLQTNVLPIPEFSETPDEIKSEISVSDRFGHHANAHGADIPITDVVNYLRLHPILDSSIRSWLYTKLYGRFAGPFTCLVVVLIAVPSAAAAGRRSVFVGVAASITVFFVYYLLQQLGFAFGEAGRLPSWLAAWLPNFVFGIAGLWMMARVR